MNLFADSNLEALAFNYVSLGFFNLWTWVAVITAAFSLWKVRAAGVSTPSSSDFGSLSSKNNQHLNGSMSFSEITLTQPKTVEELPIRSSTGSALHLASADVHGGDDIAVTKGAFKFFSTYYVDEREGSDNLTAEEENEDEVVEGCGEWWDTVLEMEMGDMSWYRYQDLTVLNGNVVRLWDGRRGVKKSYGTDSCFVW